jgi:serine protease Do
VTLGEFKEKKAARKTEYRNVLQGISVEELTPGLRAKLNLPENLNGVVVTEVGPDNPAQGILQAGDLIQEMNRQEIRDTNEYDQIASKIGEKDNVLLLIYRDGGSIYVTIRP